MWSKGYGSAEAKQAFTRAREIATTIDNPEERFGIYYGQCGVNLLRGELASAQDVAQEFLRDAQREERKPAITVAHRLVGLVLLAQGHFAEARDHFQEAVRIYDPSWERDDRFGLSHDPGASPLVYIALIGWLLGELGQTRDLINEAVARSVETAHAPTLANTYIFVGLLDMYRGSAEAARKIAEALGQLSSQHGLSLYLAIGAVQLAWANAHLADGRIGAEELRQHLKTYTELGNRCFVPVFKGSLAEIEVRVGELDEAVTDVNEALTLADETGEHWTDAFLHRIRGEILLKRDPANTGSAEEAFLTAIAVAQQQKAKSFELRAALSLAKLYQSTRRPADAHAVLEPALEGFSPTSEFPEIQQAQTLFAALT